jgi:hypothetical protein
MLIANTDLFAIWGLLAEFTKEIKMKALNSNHSKLILAVGLISASALMSVGVDVLAQDQVQTQTQVQMYGSQLMTAAERTEYQSKMRTLKTEKERDAFRLDHHDKMKVRAAEKGVTLPNTLPAVGAGPKANSGMGAGPGSGMGAGQGSPASAPGGGKGPGR